GLPPGLDAMALAVADEVGDERFAVRRHVRDLGAGEYVAAEHVAVALPAGALLRGKCVGRSSGHGSSDRRGPNIASPGTARSLDLARGSGGPRGARLGQVEGAWPRAVPLCERV